VEVALRKHSPPNGWAIRSWAAHPPSRGRDAIEKLSLRLSSSSARVHGRRF